MALDTEQKRGSSIGIGLPFRRWILKPTDGVNSESERLSLLKMCSSVGTQPPSNRSNFSYFIIRDDPSYIYI